MNILMCKTRLHKAGPYWLCKNCRACAFTLKKRDAPHLTNHSGDTITRASWQEQKKKKKIIARKVSSQKAAHFPQALTLHTEFGSCVIKLGVFTVSLKKTRWKEKKSNRGRSKTLSLLASTRAGPALWQDSPMLKLLHDPISVAHSTARPSCAVCHSQLWIPKNIGWIQGKNICCDAFAHADRLHILLLAFYSAHCPGAWMHRIQTHPTIKAAQRSRRTTLKQSSCFVGNLIDQLLQNTCKQQQLQISVSAAAAARRFPSPITMSADWLFDGPPFILNHQHGQFAESMNIKLHKSFF